MTQDCVYQAIETHYHGATNNGNARIYAKAQAGSIWVNWESGENDTDNHRRAANALCTKFGWTGPYYGKLYIGGLRDMTGYVFVFGGKEETR